MFLLFPPYVKPINKDILMKPNYLQATQLLQYKNTQTNTSAKAHSDTHPAHSPSFNPNYKNMASKTHCLYQNTETNVKGY